MASLLGGFAREAGVSVTAIAGTFCGVSLLMIVSVVLSISQQSVWWFLGIAGGVGVALIIMSCWPNLTFRTTKVTQVNNDDSEVGQPVDETSNLPTLALKVEGEF